MKQLKQKLKWTLGMILPIALNAAALSPQAWAGGESGGGGDAVTEMRIDEIRADILKWINEGGGFDLKLPVDLSHEVYRAAMSRLLERHAVVIGAVTSAEENSTADPELKVLVGEQPKTCRGFVSTKDQRPHILCNAERFKATSPSDQYRLIHHEYAGLARIERNDSASSDYSVSSQITDYLVPETVLRLAVRKPIGQANEGNASKPAKTNLISAGFAAGTAGYGGTVAIEAETGEEDHASARIEIGLLQQGSKNGEGKKFTPIGTIGGVIPVNRDGYMFGDVLFAHGNGVHTFLNPAIMLPSLGVSRPDLLVSVTPKGLLLWDHKTGAFLGGAGGQIAFRKQINGRLTTNVETILAYVRATDDKKKENGAFFFGRAGAKLKLNSSMALSADAEMSQKVTKDEDTVGPDDTTGFLFSVKAGGVF